MNNIGALIAVGTRNMVDYALQRLNMVESQIRPSDLTDRRIAVAMLNVAREAYLPKSLRGVAYSDGELLLNDVADAEPGRQMLAPRTVAHMLQDLELEAGDVVLLVGVGSGYEAALLSHIVQTVVGVEPDKGLAASAEASLASEDVGNVAVVQHPLEDGVANEGPFDAIMINGGVDEVPPGLLDQLKDGGRLVAVRRDGGVTRLCRWQRVGVRFAQSDRETAAAAILPAFAKEALFVF
jgi:protein-L-isoaspartate(D-aspartate) O-methyltransferase